MTTAVRIYRLAAVSIVVASASIIVPRFAATGGDGLAAAATAALVFLGLLALAVAFAIGALVFAIRSWSSLPWAARAAGVVPAIAFGGTLVWLIAYLRL